MSERGDESKPGTQDAPKEGAGRSGGASDGERSEDTDAAAEVDAGVGDEAADATKANADAADDDDATKGDAANDPVPAAAHAPSRASKLWWLLPVAVVIEFWVYGHNGYVDVCVGKEGQTDFNLSDQERTDENRWKFPRCETRLNLGLRSEFDAKVEEGAKAACRGATLFKNRGEAKQCKAGTDGWQHVVTGRMSWPWDHNYYEHLFWFLK